MMNSKDYLNLEKQQSSTLRVVLFQPKIHHFPDEMHKNAHDVVASMTTYKVVVYKGEDGYFVVECPALQGCVSQGRTKQEALKNIKEAIELYLETAREHKHALPKVEFLDVSIPA